MKKTSRFAKLLALTLSSCLIAMPIKSAAEDIDIFVGSSGGTASKPNILIVLDNTSNWARQSQKWPGGLTQGQSEVRAINTVVSQLEENSVNIGLMEFVTAGNANDDGGFIRHAIKPLSETNRSALSQKLLNIFDNINGTNEKRNSNTPYGNLMYDVYNYLSGGNSYSPGGVYASFADSDGYATNYTKFKSPLSSANDCADTYVIFISNPNASGPASDSATNTSTLAALGGNTAQIPLPTLAEQSSQVTTSLGTTAACYASANACTSGDTSFSAQCSAFTNGCSCGAAVANNAPTACPSGTSSFTVNKNTTTYSTSSVVGTAVSTTANSNSCYKNENSAKSSAIDGTDRGGLTCPASTTSGNVTTTYSCTYTTTGTKTQDVCGNNSNKYQIKQTATPTTVTKTPSTTSAALGMTSQCYADAASCSTADYAGQCSGTDISCSCSAPTQSTTAAGCAAGTSKYQVNGVDTIMTLSSTGTSTADTGPRNADEWARFMRDKGIPVGTEKRKVTTYTIDVYNAQPNATNTALMYNMAKAGNGKYFAAKNEDAIVKALKEIVVEIQAVNSTFAASSLPVSATNRAQSLNQVFIGMFRPDPKANPRWFGNLKRYKLIDVNGNVELGDNSSPSKQAVNSQTGFVTPCAISYWTNDSGNYWNINGLDDTATTCTLTNFNIYSDAPDGPQVEKGGVAQILRQGNNPPTTVTTPTWTVNRNVYTFTAATVAGNALPTFDAASSGLDSALVSFIKGEDVNTEKDGVGFTRPSIHGDVIHSRPLPVNYGGTNVTVFYGANDGTFRAVNAETGKERWAFVAPEFFSSLSRLKDNSPKVSYPGIDPAIVPTPTARNYFFDGSTGLMQKFDANNVASRVWIFPTMRRGGRMVYAFDVTNPDAPKFKWRAGCPNLDNDTGCTTGMDGIGQTWSTPVGTFIKGYTDANNVPKPVVIFGGGYDKCEDEDTKTPACSAPKGNKIYVLDADTGALVTTAAFNTTRSVIGDIAFSDIDADGKTDYAYAADTGGNVYRVNFVSGPNSPTALAPANWTINKIAASSGGGRKFQFAPALFTTRTKVYVALGSGDRERPLAENYPYAGNVQNRFYVFIDDLAKVYPAAALDLDGDDMEDYTAATTCATPEVTPASGLNGWFMQMPTKGEQVVTPALIFAGQVAFSTNRPVTDVNSCATALGEARGYLVSLFNASGSIGVSGICGGTRSLASPAGGLPPAPVISNPVIDGKVRTVTIGVAGKNDTDFSPLSPRDPIKTLSGSRKKIYQYLKTN